MEEAEFVSDEAPSTSGELEQSLGPYQEMIDREYITGYLHGIEGFSFNESFYQDEDRARRFCDSLAELYEEAREMTGAQK